MIYYVSDTALSTLSIISLNLHNSMDVWIKNGQTNEVLESEKSEFKLVLCPLLALGVYPIYVWLWFSFANMG